MNDHRPVLEQWIQALAVAEIGDPLTDHKHLERRHNERNQDQEEGCGGHQDRDNPGHHVAEPLPAGPHDHRRVGAKEESPEEKRALLAAPPCSELVVGRHGLVRVGGYVGHPVITADEAVQENARGDGDQSPNGINRAFRADCEERLMLPTAYKRADHRVYGEAKSQKEGESSQILHACPFRNEPD